ncbi:sugar phosphate isomerase/epimerase [Halobacteria archaeon AArc-m2/3/4]|uniref:Sugar phosphate isomerase/epimerase n=1 Tax=Natronoglomus mannanivorans TaxID=2979990 RepID=A0ABT2QD78_9EURY|nr:sugar phosphate isomerase/epimerase [Halobacteria archaeon AArc-m2/3/4]
MTASQTHEYEIGVQSVVFQALSLADLLDELETTGIDQLELWGRHLSPDDDDATIEAALERIDDADVTICGYGVVDLDDTGQAREHVAFADRLGADYVTVNYPPASDDVTEELIALAEEYDIDVAIHNYSTVHHDDLSQIFSSVDDVRDVLERYDHPRLGVCIDTGHFLVMDETPDDVLPDLGDRVVAVHLKDTSEAELEDIPGAGRLDLPHVLELLDEHAALEAPLVIEYELPAERATEALVEAAENIRAASGQ